MSNNLAIQATRRELESQESRIEQIDLQISEHETKIEVLRAERTIVRSVISHLQSTPEIINSEYEADPSDCISHDITLEILKTHSTERGMEIKDIEKVYMDRGIETVGRTVYRHVEALIKRKRAFQVNPDAMRYRRYKAVADTDEVLDNPSVNSESE